MKWSALLLGAVMILAACAARPPATETPAMAETEDGAWDNVDPTDQTVTFWYQHSGAQAESLQEIISEFNASNE